MFYSKMTDNNADSSKQKASLGSQRVDSYFMLGVVSPSMYLYI